MNMTIIKTLLIVAGIIGTLASSIEILRIFKTKIDDLRIIIIVFLGFCGCSFATILGFMI